MVTLLSQRLTSRWVHAGALGSALICATLALSGCAGFGSGTSALQGEWILVDGSDLDGVFIESSTPVTLEFTDGLVQGQAPCNGYSGTVSEGPGSDGIGALSLTSINRTEIGCAEPQQYLLESRYFAALESVDSVSRDLEQLELTGDDIYLRFELSENREG